MRSAPSAKRSGPEAASGSHLGFLEPPTTLWSFLELSTRLQSPLKPCQPFWKNLDNLPDILDNLLNPSRIFKTYLEKGLGVGPDKQRAVSEEVGARGGFWLPLGWRVRLLEVPQHLGNTFFRYSLRAVQNILEGFRRLCRIFRTLSRTFQEGRGGALQA